MSYKKLRRTTQVDQEKQAEFIKEYETLKATVDEDEPVLFIDAASDSATKVASGCIRTGVDKAIATTGSRTRINMLDH